MSEFLDYVAILLIVLIGSVILEVMFFHNWALQRGVIIAKHGNKNKYILIKKEIRCYANYYIANYGGNGGNYHFFILVCTYKLNKDEETTIKVLEPLLCLYKKTGEKYDIWSCEKSLLRKPLLDPKECLFSYNYLTKNIFLNIYFCYLKILILIGMLYMCAIL